MNLNLDQLKETIPAYLAGKRLLVFPGVQPLFDPHEAVFWDIERHPDFRQFVDVAEKLDVKLLLFAQREFSGEMVDDALGRLEATEMPREEQRAIEHRLRELRKYDGFTCAIDLGFEHERRFYCFALRTDWYAELLDLTDEIDEASPGDEDGEEGPMSGYFSRN